MERKVQFSKMLQLLPPEVTLRLGQVGKIVGIKFLENQTESYMIEFQDNIRVWLLKDELYYIEI